MEVRQLIATMAYSSLNVNSEKEKDIKENVQLFLNNMGRKNIDTKNIICQMTNEEFNEEEKLLLEKCKKISNKELCTQSFDNMFLDIQDQNKKLEDCMKNDKTKKFQKVKEEILSDNENLRILYDVSYFPYFAQKIENKTMAEDRRFGTVLITNDLKNRYKQFKKGKRTFIKNGKIQKIKKLYKPQLLSNLRDVCIPGGMKQKNMKGENYYIQQIYDLLKSWGIDDSDIKPFLKAYLEDDIVTLMNYRDLQGIVEENIEKTEDDYDNFANKFLIYELLEEVEVNDETIKYLLNNFVSHMGYKKTKKRKKVLNTKDYAKGDLGIIEELNKIGSQITPWSKVFYGEELCRTKDKVRWFRGIVVDIDLNKDGKRTLEELAVMKKEVKKLIKNSNLVFNHSYDTRNGVHYVLMFDRPYHIFELNIAGYKTLCALVNANVRLAVGKKYADCIDDSSTSPTYVHRLAGFLHAKFDKEHNRFFDPYQCGSLFYDYKNKKRSVNSILYGMREKFKRLGKDTLAQAAEKLRKNLTPDGVIYSHCNGFTATTRDNFFMALRKYGMHQDEKGALEKLKKDFERLCPFAVVNKKLYKKEARKTVAGVEFNKMFGYELGERVHMKDVGMPLKEHSNSLIPVFKREKNKQGYEHTVLCFGDASVMDFEDMVKNVLETKKGNAYKLILYIMGIEIINKEEESATKSSIQELNKSIKTVQRKIRTIKERINKYNGNYIFKRFNKEDDLLLLEDLENSEQELKNIKNALHKGDTLPSNYKDLTDNVLVMAKTSTQRINSKNLNIKQETAAWQLISAQGFIETNVISKNDLPNFDSTIQYKYDCELITILSVKKCTKNIFDKALQIAKSHKNKNYTRKKLGKSVLNNKEMLEKYNMPDTRYNLNYKQCLVSSSFTYQQKHNKKAICRNVKKYWKRVSDKIIFDIEKSCSKLNNKNAKDFLTSNISNLPVKIIMSEMKKDTELSHLFHGLSYNMAKIAIQEKIKSLLNKEERIKTLCKNNDVNELKIHFFVDKKGIAAHKKTITTCDWNSKNVLNKWVFAYVDPDYYQYAA